MRITWLGHSSFMLQGADGRAVLIDPFVQGNPRAPSTARDLLNNIDTILLTHGHGDHMGDAIEIARLTGSSVVAIYELAHHLIRSGVSADRVIDLNIGGSIDLGQGLVVHMVPAMHSTSIPNGDFFASGGAAAGFVVEMDGTTLYHAGDTAVFSDMKLIQELYAPTIGLLPIGDRYTMSPRAAAYACNEFLNLKTVIPMHFDTFPILTGKVEEFKSLVQRGEVVILPIGEGRVF